MDLEQVEKFVRMVCLRLGEQYGNYVTVSVGKLDGEGCPDVCFHVVGGGLTYSMLVGSQKTVVTNGGKEVATYNDLTKSDFFTDESDDEEDGEITP